MLLYNNVEQRQTIVSHELISDRMVKILLIGNSGVGKSSLLMQYSDHKFAYNYYNTIGVDYVFACRIRK